MSKNKVSYPGKKGGRKEELKNSSEDKKEEQAKKHEQSGNKTKQKSESVSVKKDKKKANPSAKDVLRGKASVPTKTQGFDTWFDDLTVHELKKLMDNKKIKKSITNNLRDGNKHEWFKVSEAVKAKSWGVPLADIKYNAVTQINTIDANDLWFVDIEVPEKTRKRNKKLRGKEKISGRHADGLKIKVSTHSSEENSASGLAHKELDKLFQESNSKEEYLIRLNEWADKHLVVMEKDTNRKSSNVTMKSVEENENGCIYKGRNALPECIRLPKSGGNKK